MLAKEFITSQANREWEAANSYPAISPQHATSSSFQHNHNNIDTITSLILLFVSNLCPIGDRRPLPNSTILGSSKFFLLEISITIVTGYHLQPKLQFRA